MRKIGISNDSTTKMKVINICIILGVTAMFGCVNLLIPSTAHREYDAWTDSLVPVKKIPKEIVNEKVIYSYRCPERYHEVDCPSCKGGGYTVKTVCSTCAADGWSGCSHCWPDGRCDPTWEKSFTCYSCNGFKKLCEPDGAIRPREPNFMDMVNVF